MTLLEMCKYEYDNIERANGFPPSTVKLCNEHNLALTQEYRERSKVFKATCDEIHGSRVYMLFNKPVVEESSKGHVKCFICDYTKRKCVDYYEC